MTIAAEHIYGYTSKGQESEFIVVVPGTARLRQMERS
jgi:hypothetical protein